MKRFPFLVISLAVSLLIIQQSPSMECHSQVQEEIYGEMPDGQKVKIFTLTNRNGLIAKVTEYGAILVSMEVPDRFGKLADVTHGYDTLEGWLTNSVYFGATVGRFGNRIQQGEFTLDGKRYSLATNNGPDGNRCHLHGGLKGFDKVLWSGRPIANHGVEFTYLSKDGEEGYPGNVAVKVTYILNDQNELTWEAEATTDAPTILNIVHHSYWNLSGDATCSIENHLLQLHAKSFLPTDSGLIPRGHLASVIGTPLDFTHETVIGARIDDDFEALQFGGGYDHAWVLEEGDGVRLAARLKDPASGRVMQVFTNQPAIQFYTGNFLDGSVTGKKGVKYAKRTALCLETEGFPDAPNHESFPSAVIRPGELYTHTMIHKFSVE